MKFSKLLLFIFVVVSMAGESQAKGQSSLRQLNADLTELTARVSPAVVQIIVSGYGPAVSKDSTVMPIVARQQSIGSGVILDASGYIITNAHVVKGAERIQVVITKTTSDSRSALPA